MAWNGSGTFSMLYSWVARRDAGSPTNIIGATEMDAQFADIKTGLETCVTRDGQNAASANLPMGGFLHTNVGAATSRSNYGRVAELQDGTIFKAASPGGTGDAMTGTIAPAPSAYTAGMRVTIVAPGANTIAAPTINVNALGVKTIRKHQGTLTVPEYATSDTLELIYDGTGFELMNPKTPAAIGMTSFTTDATGGAMNDFLPFVDTSESGADNKVTVQSFLDNVHANATVDTTLGATGDKLLLTDASESNATQAVTIDNLMINALQLLTTDSTIGATGDFIPFVDASESNAGNKGTVADLFYNAITNFTQDTAVDPASDRVVTKDTSASLPKGVLLKDLKVSEHITIAVGDETTAITTGTAKVTFRMPYAFTLTDVRASVNTVSSSGLPTVNIKESGTTIFSTKLTIDANEKTSVTAATPYVFSDTSLADDAEMTIDIDVAGTGAKGLKIILYGYRT